MEIQSGRIRLTSCLALLLALCLQPASCQSSESTIREEDTVEREGVLLHRSSEKPVDGVVVWLGSSGKTERAIDYRKGLRDGFLKAFDRDGTEVYREHWQGGMLEGPAIEFFKNGKKKSERSFHGGTAEGAYREWNESGTLRVEGAYRAGKKAGEWKCFSEAGKIIELVVFSDGVIHSTIIDGEDIEIAYGKLQARLKGADEEAKKAFPPLVP